MIKNLIKLALSPIKKETVIKNITKIDNLTLIQLFNIFEILITYIETKPKKNDPATSSSPKKLATLPDMQDLNPIVLKPPKILSNAVNESTMSFLQKLKEKKYDESKYEVKQLEDWDGINNDYNNYKEDVDADIDDENVIGCAQQ